MSRENPNLAPDILGCLLYLLTNADFVSPCKGCRTSYRFLFGLDAEGFPDGIDRFREMASRCDFLYSFETTLVGEYYITVDIMAIFKHAYEYSLSKRQSEFLKTLKYYKKYPRHESPQSSS